MYTYTDSVYIVFYFQIRLYVSMYQIYFIGLYRKWLKLISVYFMHCFNLYIVGTGSGVKLSGSSASLGKHLDTRGRAGSIQSVDSASMLHDSDHAMRHLFDQVTGLIILLS